MTLLGEAYVHLKPFRADETRLRAIATELEQRCPIIADKIYGSFVEVEIRMEEGSLRVWILVAGLFGGVISHAYDKIADYPQFKAGIRELYKDAKEFGEENLRVIEKESDASPDQIYRVERRTKTVGKVHRLMKELDRLNQDASNLSDTDFRDKKLQLSYRFHALLEDISDDRDRDFLKEAMLPAGLTPLPVPQDDLYGRYLLAPREFDWEASAGVPVLQSAGVAPDMPRLRRPTTIILKDGRCLVLDTDGPKRLRLR